MTPHAAALELERVSSEYMLRWLGRLPGVTITDFGQARGACCPETPDLNFVNTVHLLLPEDIEQVPLIAEHYGAAGIRPWLELMPAPGFDELAAALDAVAGRQIGFKVVLEQELPAATSAPAAVSVELVGPALEDFASVLPRGQGVPEEAMAQATVFSREHAGVEGARLYLARVDGVPAAAGVLLLAGELAYLAEAATLEPFRRRGCQGALIQRRLADAAAAGCRRVCVLTTWGSQSHANLVRAGFRAAYTKAAWRLDRPR